MATTKANRRASVQFNIRVEPAEAALIRRVIPKRHVTAVAVRLLVDYARQLEARNLTRTEEDPAAA
jgi:hypothetical protein